MLNSKLTINSTDYNYRCLYILQLNQEYYRYYFSVSTHSLLATIRHTEIARRQEGNFAKMAPSFSRAEAFVTFV